MALDPKIKQKKCPTRPTKPKNEQGWGPPRKTQKTCHFLPTKNEKLFQKKTNTPNPPPIFCSFFCLTPQSKGRHGRFAGVRYALHGDFDLNTREAPKGLEAFEDFF